MPLLDALKAIACLAIVAHHLAAYGPMAETAHPLAPWLIDGFYEHGRMAVPVFLVIGGFLFAGKYAPSEILIVSNPVLAIKRRYFRLAVPYLAALILAIVCSALARVWMADDDSIPPQPGFGQLLAHAFLVQDWLDQEALSAGVWYVAIDFQLFAVAVMLLWLSRQMQHWWDNVRAISFALTVGLTTASLFVFNRDKSLDETPFYFFGSFGLGILIYWTSNRRNPALWFTLLVLLVGAALLMDFRPRIAVAGTVMLTLGLASKYPLLQNLPVPIFLTYLGRISYSIFLVHFPLCLIVNAAFVHFFPDQPIAHAWGLVFALCVSIFGGALFFQFAERGWSRVMTSERKIKFSM